MKNRLLKVAVYRRIVVLSLLTISLIAPAYTQHIKIGDDLSHLVLRDVQNYQSDSLRIADHRGKLIILDFWNVSCGSCIANMPAMHELQETFGDKIQVILVSDDEIERMERALARNENIRNISLPSSINNRDLFDRMPFLTLPSHVWLDQKGIVKYIAEIGRASCRERV